MRLRLAKVAIGLLLVLVALPFLGSCDDERERLGEFTLLHDRQTFAGHSATRSSLRHGRRVIAARVSDAAVDPRHPDRVLYSTRDTEGTFHFDARTGRTRRVAERSHNVGDDDLAVGDGPRLTRWSPDGRHVFVGETWAPIVADLETGATRPLAVAVGGVALRAWSWSPDGRRLAAVTAVERDMQTRQDLVAIDVETMAVEYVATVEGGATRGTTLWRPGDFWWQGECLMTNGAFGGRTIVLAPEDRWVEPNRLTPRRVDCPQVR